MSRARYCSHMMARVVQLNTLPAWTQRRLQPHKLITFVCGGRCFFEAENIQIFWTKTPRKMWFSFGDLRNIGVWWDNHQDWGFEKNIRNGGETLLRRPHSAIVCHILKNQKWASYDIVRSSKHFGISYRYVGYLNLRIETVLQVSKPKTVTEKEQ